METGQRKDKDGNTVPRDIISEFTATFSGVQVFRAALQQGISANPYLSFHMRVPGPGELVLAWKDDAGKITTETVPIAVTP
jgi:sulfur-oxidizing protein SoxZ